MKMIIVLLLCAVSAQAAEKWPGFLGAGRTKLPADSLPLEWTPTENIAWSVPTPGYGQSSPVVWDDNVYITAVQGENKETLFLGCYSLQSGELLWNSEQPSSYPEKNSVYISRAAPTPVVDSDGVYAYFESGDIVSVSHSGEERWQVSLTEKHGAPKNKFGLAASPVQTADRIIVMIDDDEGPSYLTAISKEDGRELWKVDRSSRRSWSSPMLLPVANGQQVVCSSAGSIDGYDPKNGKQLWSFDEVGGNTSTTPTFVADGKVMIAASPGRSGENAEMARKSNGLFSIASKESSSESTDWQPGFEWTNSDPTPSWASPIAHQGYAYWVNRVGAVFCLNIESGDTEFTKRIQQSCWATPVGIDDRIYFFGKGGLTTVLATGDEFKIIAENTLWNEDQPPKNNIPKAKEETAQRRGAAQMFSKPTVYGVAMVPGHIVLRTGSQLFCIRKPKE